MTRWRYQHTVLVLSVYGFFTVQAARFAISPVVPDILDSFQVSKGLIGLVLTGMWAAYAIFQFPGGVLGDRYGERKVILAAFLLTGLGSFLLALAPSVAVFGIFVIVMGAGTGLYYPVAATFLTKVYKQHGQALGFLTAGSSLAGMIAPVVVAFVSVRFGWRVAIPLGAVLALAGIGFFVFRVRPTEPMRPDRPVRESFEVSNVWGLLGRRRVVYTIFLSVIGAFTFQSVVSFLPTFLIEFWSISTEQAGIAFGSLFLLSAFAQVGMGKLSDMFTRDTALSASMILSGTGLSTLLLGSGVISVVIGIGLLGVGMSWGGVINARFADAFGESERGTGLGLARSFFILLAASGNVITGVLVDVSGWTTAYGLVVALLTVGVIGMGINRAARLGL